MDCRSAMKVHCRMALTVPCRRALKVPCRRAMKVPCRRALKVHCRRALKVSHIEEDIYCLYEYINSYNHFLIKCSDIIRLMHV